MGARTVSSDEEEVEEREEEEDVEDNEAAADEDDDDEEDDEEGQDEYEKDDFIVDDVEEEEEAPVSSDEEAKAKKKKRKKRDAEENYELDEDDYELLQEANVTGFHRPKSQASKTKFKRLKKAGRIASEAGKGAQMGFSDDEDVEGNRHERTAEEELKRTLFGDDEGAPPEDLGEEEEPEEEEEDIGDEDEMADFIVDEEEVDEHGQPVRRRKAKKKGPRQAAGISSMALQEAQEIFGDVAELLDRRKVGLNADRAEDEEGVDEEGETYSVGRYRKKKLEEEFEPSVLAEKYMTDRDNRIRETDVPERLQLLEEVTGVIPVKESTLREAEWIYDQSFGYTAERIREEFQYLSSMDKSEIVKQISYVLTQLHDHKLEIPFIGMYRKEGCLDLLGDPNSHNNYKDVRDKSKYKSRDSNDKRRRLNDYKVLWQIFSMDKRWWLLQRRKNVLRGAYEKRARLEARRDATKADMVKNLLGALQEAQSDIAVDDVDAKYSLHFPADEVEVQQGQFKRPKRRSRYTICRKAGINSVAKHFGLTPEQFGENLQAMYKRHDFEDSSSTPEDVASEINTGEFTNPQSVLSGARHMAAVEISTEPAVRDYVRNIFSEKAVVNTKPTKEGNSVIDPYHRYAVVKWLSSKPVNEFHDGQWLLIQKADEEKLIEVTVGLPKDVIREVMQEFETQYLSEGVSRTAQLWNEQRKQILEEAVTGMLLPLMEKETRAFLTSRAKQWVAWEYGKALWKKVSVAPCSCVLQDTDERIDEDQTPRVLACCGGSSNPPTAFVLLDSAGEVVNTLYTPYLGVYSKGNPPLEEKKARDSDRLLKFIIEYKPHVVVLGAANITSRRLRDGVCEAIFRLIEHHPREMPDNVQTINTYFGDEALPRIYEASQISSEQLPGQPGIIRRAVALGRYLQNPLAMVSTLCGPNLEILSLKLYALESFLTDDERYNTLEQVMVTVTNQVGVDVNLAAVHEWLFAPLQFVSGLGARKASTMQRFIQGVGRISTRKEMLTSLRLMKKNVFINSCGFLRIRGSGQAASGNQIMDPLDDTRIHPESYELAKKLAEFLYLEDHGNEEVDDEMLEMALEHVKENPGLLKALNIEEYAKDVQERDGVSKLETLKDIQVELLHGYQDWRDPFNQLGQNEEFALMTGEDDETLCEGKLVNARVLSVNSNNIFCKLENGLDGFIQPEDLSDETDVDPLDRVSVGSIITCRVKTISKNRYAVDLTCKTSDLQAEDWGRIQNIERYFCPDVSIKAAEEKAKKVKEDEKRKSFKPRMIVHPQFQNISMADAIEALADKDVGEIIIRPSSKGPTHLSITLKFYDGVYTHIDVLEGGKDSKDFTSFLSLGKTLQIGDDTFEDLDEVIARYVDPLVSNLKEMLRYRKFRRGKKEEVDALLRNEKNMNPSRIVYAFSVSHEHPGAFMLSYLRSVNVHHEYISLYPNGFKFRKRMFDNIDKLVNHFQKHVNDPISEKPSHRSLAAMVPMKSPAPVPAVAGTGGGLVPDRPPATATPGWQNDNWASAKEPGTEKGWDQLTAPSPNNVGANDWSNHGPDNYARKGDGWNQTGGDGDGWNQTGGGGDGWANNGQAGGNGWTNRGQAARYEARERDPQNSEYGGRFGRRGGFGGSESWRGGGAGRGGGMYGSGRRGGRGDGFGGGRSGRGNRGRGDGFGGRWARGRNSRGGYSDRGNGGEGDGDSWVQNQGGGSRWGQQSTVSRGSGNTRGWGQRTERHETGENSGWKQQTDDDGWGKTDGLDKKMTDNDGWGTETAGGDGWDKQAQGKDDDWGHQETQKADGVGQQTTGTGTGKNDGWGEPEGKDDGWGQTGRSQGADADDGWGAPDDGTTGQGWGD